MTQLVSKRMQRGIERSILLSACRAEWAGQACPAVLAIRGIVQRCGHAGGLGLLLTFVEGVSALSREPSAIAKPRREVVTSGGGFDVLLHRNLKSCGRRRLSLHLRQCRIHARPRRRLRRPDRDRRPRDLGIIQRPGTHEYQVRTRLCLTEHVSTALRTEASMHDVAAVCDTAIVTPYALDRHWRTSTRTSCSSSLRLADSRRTYDCAATRRSCISTIRRRSRSVAGREVQGRRRCPRRSRSAMSVASRMQSIALTETAR
jgi:hypothetical protein